MSYQPSQSGQRSRRGGSRNRGDSRSGRPNSERRSGNGGGKPAAPASLWQKITAFFTGSKSAPAAKKSAYSDTLPAGPLPRTARTAVPIPNRKRRVSAASRNRSR